MTYLLKTLEKFKNAPSLYLLASVRDPSPPTSGGKGSRNGGIGWGKILFRYDSNNYIYLERKKQNKKTAEKSLKLLIGLARFNELAAKFKLLQHVRCNDFLPQFFRPDLTSAISLRAIFNCKNSVIEFNHNINKLTLGGIL